MMKNKQCWWIFNHKWSTWKQYGFSYQRRHCLKCGKIQTRGA